MRKNLRAFPLWIFLLFFTSCQPAPDALPTADILIAKNSLRVEVADTPDHAQRGLMFRKELPENCGMLFPFESPRQAVFWMRNTPLPLSIAFLDAEGGILEIRHMEPLDETHVVSQSHRVSFALEVNRGWFERHHITPGARLQWKEGWHPASPPPPQAP